MLCINTYIKKEMYGAFFLKKKNVYHKGNLLHV